MSVLLAYQSVSNSVKLGMNQHPIYDYRKVRKWCHLDTLQYKTFIEARVPRITDEVGKIRTIDVPWAEGSQRHSYLFEKKL